MRSQKALLVFYIGYCYVSQKAFVPSLKWLRVISLMLVGTENVKILLKVINILFEILSVCNMKFTDHRI